MAPGTGATLPALPAPYRGDLVTDPVAVLAWAGASGPFWHPPRAVLRPSDTADVALVVSWADREGVSLVPRGAGTGMPGGNVGPEVVLDLSRLTGSDPDPDPAALRLGAGVTGATARDLARGMNRDLPALPSSARWCTVGGMVACNAAGARSLRYGAARRWTAELTLVRADGTIDTLRRGEPAPDPWAALTAELRSTLPAPLPWPRVRKNSSGYALDALQASGDALDLVVGSEGTLGVVTEVVLETRAIPATRAVLLLGIPDRRTLPQVVAPLRTDPRVQACEYFGRRLVDLGELESHPRLQGVHCPDGLVLVELAGTRDAVEDGVDLLVGSAPAGCVVAQDDADMEALWEIRHAANPVLARALRAGRRSTQFIEDCVVPPEALPAFLEGLDAILDRHSTEAVVFGHVADGNLHVNPLVDLHAPRWRARVADILDDTVDLVASLGGTLSGEHGDGRLRTPFLHRIFAPVVLDAFGGVKERLDPRGTLNPGVVVPVAGVEPLAGLGDAPGFRRGTQGPERAR